MSKKPIIGGIIVAVIICLVAAGTQINPDSPENEKRPNSEAWSTRIAGPEFDNITTHTFQAISLERNIPYKFEFVPMGDSPERLKISVGNAFSELFILEKTLVDTGISKYYTWEYTGDKNFQISTQQCPNEKTCSYDITIDRFGNLKGSVSIAITRVSI